MPLFSSSERKVGNWFAYIGIMEGFTIYDPGKIDMRNWKSGISFTLPITETGKIAAHVRYGDAKRFEPIIGDKVI